MRNYEIAGAFVRVKFSKIRSHYFGNEFKYFCRFAHVVIHVGISLKIFVGRHTISKRKSTSVVIFNSLIGREQKISELSKTDHKEISIGFRDKIYSTGTL